MFVEGASVHTVRSPVFFCSKAAKSCFGSATPGSNLKFNTCAKKSALKALLTLLCSSSFVWCRIVIPYLPCDYFPSSFTFFPPTTLKIWLKNLPNKRAGARLLVPPKGEKNPPFFHVSWSGIHLVWSNKRTPPEVEKICAFTWPLRGWWALRIFLGGAYTRAKWL